MSHKVSGSLLILLALAAALTYWMGPRPVRELWVAEELSPARAAGLGVEEISRECGGGEEGVPGLAEANGIPAARLPPFSSGAQLFDADNDGDLDLFEVGAPGASLGGPAPSRLFLHQNDGKGGFREIGDLLGPAFTEPRLLDGGRRAACADLDGDGRLDLLIPLEGGKWLALWNRLARRHYLRLALEPDLEKGGGTARVEILAGGKRQVRLVGCQPGAGGVAHFGLGESLRADEGSVLWPSGRRSPLPPLEADREHRIKEEREKTGD